MEGILGSIMPWSAAIIPKGWLPCDGRLLPVAQNHALASLIGTTYGGDGVTNFALPDLRGRVPMGADGAQPPGAVGGSEQVALDATTMPTHSHALRAVSATGTSTSFANVVLAAAGTAANTPTPPAIYAPPSGPSGPLASDSITPTGGQPHPNMQPSLAINFLICVMGKYPNRP